MPPEEQRLPTPTSTAPDEPPPALKAPVDPSTLTHRQLREGPFWRTIPAYAEVTEAEFLDHKWQAKHSITNIPKLLATLTGLVSEDFIKDAERGFAGAPMSVRVSPYLLSLIDWSRPYEDPLRLQFIPLQSRFRPDHPKLDLDSLHERADMPVPGLTPRYFDKALFLPPDAWLDAITRVVEQGRKLHKEVVIHTHFNHPSEITAITKAAMDRLFERGITVRNQTVLQRGVNDQVATMRLLVKRLSYVNVHPYYIYMHDLVKGVEDLRTTLSAGLAIEKGIRGGTAGFN